MPRPRRMISAFFHVRPRRWYCLTIYFMRDRSICKMTEHPYKPWWMDGRRRPYILPNCITQCGRGWTRITPCTLHVTRRNNSDLRWPVGCWKIEIFYIKLRRANSKEYFSPRATHGKTQLTLVADFKGTQRANRQKPGWCNTRFIDKVNCTRSLCPCSS